MKGMGGSKRSVSDGCMLTWYIHVVETHRNEKKSVDGLQMHKMCYDISPHKGDATKLGPNGPDSNRLNAKHQWRGSCMGTPSRERHRSTAVKRNGRARPPPPIGILVRRSFRLLLRTEPRQKTSGCHPPPPIPSTKSTIHPQCAAIGWMQQPYRPPSPLPDPLVSCEKSRQKASMCGGSQLTSVNWMTPRRPRSARQSWAASWLTMREMYSISSERNHFTMVRVSRR